MRLNSVNKTSRRFALVTTKLWRTAARNDGDSYFRIAARAISDSHCVSQARSKIHDVTNFAKTAFINLSAAARTRRPFDQSLSKTWMVVSTRLISCRIKVESEQIQSRTNPITISLILKHILSILWIILRKIQVKSQKKTYNTHDIKKWLILN